VTLQVRPYRAEIRLVGSCIQQCLYYGGVFELNGQYECRVAVLQSSSRQV
jgi:hypothetical protein